MKNYSESNDATNSADFDLPDWSGTDRTPPHISVQAAFRFCERYAAEMPEVVKKLRAERKQPCSVEFVL